MADVLCPLVIGRAHELEALRAGLEEARDGRGRVVFVLGEAGIGKSRLARELVTAAKQRRMRVLRGRAVPGSAEVAFRPLAEALGGALPTGEIRPSADLAPWLPALAAVVPGLGRPGHSPTDESPPARAEAIVRLLRALTDPGGGLLILEDLHWADPETLAIVDHLTDNLDRAPVMCVVTVRSDEPSPGRDLARAVEARRSARVLLLSRLNDVQVAAMVHACTNGAGASELTRVTAGAEGVPFLVEELLAAPGVPTTFAEAVQRRLDRLPADDRRVLTAAATLGRHFDWRLLAAASGLDSTAVSDALARAVATQLLAVEGDGFRYRHALTRDAVLDTVLPTQSRGIAAAALAALDAAHPQLDGNEREVAAALAERAEQFERAGALHLAGGREALGKGALGSATVALQRASSLLESGDRRDEASELLVEALAQAGRVDDALAVGTGLVGHLQEDRATSLHLRLARAALVATRWSLAAEQISAAHDRISATSPLELQAQLAVSEAQLALDTDNAGVAFDRAQAALALAQRATRPEIACEALQLVGRCERASSLERAEAAFAAALAIAEANDLAVWRLRALHELGTIGLLDRGDCRVLVEARDLAEELGALSTVAVVDVQLAAGYQIVHDLERSLQHGFAAIGRARDLGLDYVLAVAWHLMGTSAALTRDRPGVVTAAGAARAATPDDPVTEAMVLLGCDALLALIEEERNAAANALDAGMALLRGAPAAPPAQFRGLWPIVLGLAADKRAEAAIDEVEASGVGVNRLNQGYLAYARAVLAGRVDREQAAAFMADGDRALSHGPFWHHLGRRLVSEAAIADGWGRPDAWLLAAEQWFGGHGYGELGDACRRLQRREMAGPTQWARYGVTRREADVLSLVIEGHSNKEIAARLFVSPRTVEKHVESLMRKTAARSRTQLAMVAAGTPSSTT